MEVEGPSTSTSSSLRPSTKPKSGLRCVVCGDSVLPYPAALMHIYRLWVSTMESMPAMGAKDSFDEVFGKTDNTSVGMEEIVPLVLVGF